MIAAVRRQRRRFVFAVKDAATPVAVGELQVFHQLAGDVIKQRDALGVGVAPREAQLVLLD